MKQYMNKPLSNRVIAFLLIIVTIFVLIATSSKIGLTWDEPAYFVASEDYMRWFGKIASQPGNVLSDQVITDNWGFNHEHPPFDKVWSGVFWAASKGVFDDMTAHRLGNMVLAGILVALVFLMVANHYGTVAGLVSAGALFTMPRFFFHAHLAALDVPVTVMIFAVGFVYVSTVDRAEFKWTLLLGLLWGLALATKINALFVIPPLLTIWTLIFQRRRLFLIGRLLMMGLIGFIVFLAIWPWLYYDTFERLIGYLNFMMVSHYKITQVYHGILFSPPPWHFPFVMTLLVVPLSLTILYFLGSIQGCIKWKTKALVWFFIMGALLPLIIFASGKAQLFDNDRLFMSTFPYLAALAGIGFYWLAQGIVRISQELGMPKLVKPFGWLLACIVFLPHTLLAYQLYPHLLSYYSEIVGGLSGADRFGMETTYWCETYQDALTYLNENAPPGSIVWAEGYDVLLYYQLHGKLRPDLRIAGGANPQPVFKNIQMLDNEINNVDFAVVEYRQSGFYNRIVSWLNVRKPIYIEDFRNIPLIGIFER